MDSRPGPRPPESLAFISGLLDAGGTCSERCAKALAPLRQENRICAEVGHLVPPLYWPIVRKSSYYRSATLRLDQ